MHKQQIPAPVIRNKGSWACVLYVMYTYTFNMCLLCVRHALISFGTRFEHVYVPYSVHVHFDFPKYWLERLLNASVTCPHLVCVRRVFNI